jgi:hypothetical protein
MSCYLNAITALPSRKGGSVFTEQEGGWVPEPVWTQRRRGNLPYRRELNPNSLDVLPACGLVITPINLSGSSVNCTSCLITVLIWNKSGILIFIIEFNWIGRKLLGLLTLYWAVGANSQILYHTHLCFIYNVLAFDRCTFTPIYSTYMYICMGILSLVQPPLPIYRHNLYKWVPTFLL